MTFSVIIPLYNRPEEVNELLSSLCEQTVMEFEVIVVEDGSTKKSDMVVEKYRDKLDITYFYKTNSGPGLSRNAGAEKAKKDYLIFFDSDCIIPPRYIETVSHALHENFTDAYGGPDAALSTFTPIQKAINYSMTSFFTTGGIRGKSQSMDRFHPRSFNMGVSRQAFSAIGGYGNMRFGEDIDFSLRLLKAGFRTTLFPEAYVYHKRRATFRQFFKQVHNSGIARINLHLAHPGSLKPVHTLPALFVIAMTVILLLSLLHPILLVIPFLYSLAVFGDSLRLYKSFTIACYSIVAAWTQTIGYGTGFLSAAWRRLVLKQAGFSAFEKKFYN
ncbi:MAG: glycosyltransferase [Porphyromonadaceae bacterium]|nr:glycosyltransferase [Porphyromonadaceae bacterium]